ncbi:MAG: prepilin peptidase [Gammaproteobacteria bacterium]|nr:MAG: prepilin peptidase [Gammaproteobacteria bacterium]
MLLDNFVHILFTLPSSVQLAMVFVFSALVGSFLNVVIYRLPIILERDWQAQAREILQLPAEDSPFFGLSKPRSRCRDCGRVIRAWENIPVISYLLMRGRCRGCGAKISIFYPLVELSTAVLATFVFWRLGGNAQGFFALFFVFALIALAGIDLKTQLLPDNITLPLMWAGIILSFWALYVPLETAVIGALLGYLSLWLVATLFKLLFKKDGMGLGDAKLLAAIFTWVHFQYFPLVLIVACLVGLVVTVVQRLLNAEKVINNPLPFGPYLALGGLVALLYGQELVVWYTRLLLG